MTSFNTHFLYEQALPPENLHSKLGLVLTGAYLPHLHAMAMTYCDGEPFDSS